MWLLAGGSSIPIEVAVAQRLSGDKSLDKLSISLIDERFGPPGHANSNWQQLAEAGFDLDGANLRPVLTGEDLPKTTNQYNAYLVEQFKAADYRIGISGMGADGHTAGILPHSPVIDSDELVGDYRGPDYQRITLTPRGIAMLDEIVLYAKGESKRQQLTNLADKDLPIADQPVQIIKKIRRWSVFNDLMGEEI